MLLFIGRSSSGALHFELGRVTMASELWMTDGVVRVTTGTTLQALSQSIEVSAYDQLDLMLWINGFEGTPGNLTVEIITGMSMDSEAGWLPITSTPFSASSAVNFTEMKNFPKVLKFVRWKATLVTATAAMFSVRGMARNN